MPWTAGSVMEERLRFVARLLDGESMTDVCREFGISRKTGYKIFDRAGAPGSIKMGNTRSPFPYDAGACQSIRSVRLRLPAILRYA